MFAIYRAFSLFTLISFKKSLFFKKTFKILTPKYKIILLRANLKIENNIVKTLIGCIFGYTYLVLSMSGSFEVSLFSQITGILSLYLSLILSASAFLFSI